MLDNRVYLLLCADGTLYCGWTNDLAARLRAHNEGRGAKYTKPRLPVRLAYSEGFPTKQEAMRRECAIKRMTRTQKRALLETGAPQTKFKRRLDMVMMMIPNEALTHGGKFHADDVFSSALLQILNPELKITRAFKVPEGYEGLVFDIGWGPFDHHQKDAEKRQNGVPYASFGLLWRAFGEGLVGLDEAGRLDEHFIQPLDLDDNTGCGSEVAAIIAGFNPSWDSEASPDDCFERAVAFAKTILQNRLEGIWSITRARSLVVAALEKMEERVVVLPVFAPWKMVLTCSPAEFVVYPSQRGGYSVQAVPGDDEDHTLKCPFPEAWAGRSEEELRAVSGLQTLRFCHNNRFLITTGTLEDALTACKLART